MTLLHRCQIGTKTLQVHFGDLLRTPACAIVCSENTDMRMDRLGGPSVSAAVRAVEGEQLAADLLCHGPVAFGAVLSREARQLPARYIFFAATVAFSNGGRYAYTTSAASIRGATREALRMANRLGLRRVSFPAFGVRGAGFPPARAAELQLAAVAAGLREPGSVEHVDFVLNDMDVFLHYFRSAIVNTLGEQPRIQLSVEQRGDQLSFHLDEQGPLSRRCQKALSPRQSDGCRGSFARRAAAVGTRAELLRLGRELANCLPASLRDKLASLEPGVLVLRLELGLEAVPWEWITLAEGPLFERHQLGRRILTNAEAPVQPVAAATPRSALLVVDPTGDLPAARREGLQLMTSLARGGIDTNFLAGNRARIDAVIEALARHSLIHFAGHAGGQGWKLADGWLEPEAGGSAAQLVVANACQSALLGPAFLESGVGHYIGTWRELPDGPASIFAQAMYRAVLAGEPLGSALARARAALRAEDRDDVLGAAYVHYGDPLAALDSLLE